MTNNLTTQSSVPSTIPTSTKIATEDLGDNNGHAQIVKTIFDPSNLSAFGTLEVAPMTPVLQMDFIHGINTQSGVSTIANSGVVDTDGGRLRLQSGTNTAGSAIFNSRRPAKYRPGQGITARFTPIFTTGVASSTQIWGAGNANDGYFFGYNGANFGICHRISGVDTWITQTSWNGDKCDGSTGTTFTYDPTKGTPVMIKYPYLGYGDVFFFIENPVNGRFLLVHTIRYANTTATPQASNPSLFFYGQSLNSGNNTNLIMYCGSVGFFLSGERSFIAGPQWAMDSSKASITTETNLITIKNATTYNTVTNRGLIRVNVITISSSAAAGSAVFRFKTNATLGGSPSYTAINGTIAGGGATITSGNSIASYDVAGTTVTSGTYIFGVGVDNPNSQIIDLTPFNIFIAPGETLTISGFSTNSATMQVAINWTEDL